MKIEITSELFDKFGNISVGAIVAKTLLSDSIQENIIQSEIDAAIIKGKEVLSQHESLDSIPYIVDWRNIYKKMGCSTSKISSIESLYSYLSDKNSLPNILPMVNLYNSISCYYGLPMAGYDYDNISDNCVFLRPAKKKEQFKPLGLNQIEKTKNGEIVYADNEKVICRYWNNKDCDQTKLLSSTNNYLFIIDGAPSVNREVLKSAIDKLSNVLSSLGFETVSNAIASENNAQIDI